MNVGIASSGRYITMRALCLLTISLGLMLFGEGPEEASASIGIKFLPIRWCLVEGSPTQTDPDQVGAKDGEPHG